MTSLLAPLAFAETAADDAARAREDRIAELERKLDVVVDELSRLRTEVAVPEEPELKSSYGLGPAASKVYGRERGLSIGGYGELNYTNDVGGESGGPNDRTDALRLITYIGYKFTDRIVFNSEIEYEHGFVEGGEESGEVAVEFATLDFLWRPEVNFRAGLMLAPMGFINEIHEPPFFYGVFRPETERAILPSTWRENGAGVFGKLGETVEYRAYALTGFDATGFEAAGIRGGRQNGSESLAEDVAFVGRMDWTPDFAPGLLLGGSVYYGEADQDQPGLPDTDLWIAEGHLQYRTGGFHTRALFAFSGIEDAGDLSAALGLAADEGISDEQLGGYVELAYDVWPLLFGGEEKALEPFFRVEYVDTQRDVGSGFDADRTLSRWIYSSGVSFYPHPNVALKLEYRNRDPREGSLSDQLAVGMGFAF
jgi:opacity protein-like surface antigen